MDMYPAYPGYHLSIDIYRHFWEDIVVIICRYRVCDTHEPHDCDRYCSDKYLRYGITIDMYCMYETGRQIVILQIVIKK